MRQDFYEEYSHIEREHWWFLGRRKIILTVLDRFLPAAEPGVDTDMSAGSEENRILDIGIGSGVMLPCLQKYGTVFGCDMEEAALRFSSETSPGRLTRGEARDLPFSDESFHLVTVLDLLEHTDEDDAVLSEIGRVLHPNGLLCATVPVHPWLWGNQDLISGHVRRYRTGELERKIEAAGLSLLYRTHFNTLLFPAVAFVRLARRLVGSKPAAETVRSDFSMTKPGRLNNLLTWGFSLEAKWVRRWSLPVGVSLLCIAQKPSGARSS